MWSIQSNLSLSVGYAEKRKSCCLYFRLIQDWLAPGSFYIFISIRFKTRGRIKVHLRTHVDLPHRSEWSFTLLILMVEPYMLLVDKHDLIFFQKYSIRFVNYVEKRTTARWLCQIICIRHTPMSDRTNAKLVAWGKHLCSCWNQSKSPKHSSGFHFQIQKQIHYGESSKKTHRWTIQMQSVWQSLSR